MAKSSLVALLAVVLVVCAHALELPQKNVPLTREQLEVIEEHKQEHEFQAQVEALNDKVFPKDNTASKGEWSHESADAMQKHWENIVDRDSGEKSTSKHAVKAKVMHSKMAQAKHAAHKAIHKELHPHMVAKDAKAVHKPEHKVHKVVEKHAVHHPVQHTAHHPQHPVHKKKWIKPHAKLWGMPSANENKLFAHKPTEKQEVADELAEFDKINEEAFPSEHATAHRHETASEMHARRKAEVNSAFPSKWEAQEKKVQVIGGPKEHRGKPLGMDAKEVQVQQSLIGQRKFHSERMHAMEMNSVLHTDEERADAAKSADGELDELKKISDEVLPQTPAELEHAKKVEAQREALRAHMEAVAKAKAAHAKMMRAKHAAHKAEMAAKHHEEAHKTKLWPLAYKKEMERKKHLPQSSDKEVPSAGTDMVYLGAHQAGYAKGHHKAAAPKHAAKH